VKRSLPITTLSVDVGPVSFTNGRDHHARKRAGKHFKLNSSEMDDRHRLVFEPCEEGKLSFEEYLGWAVFFDQWPFTRNQFRYFLFSQSKPYPKMIDLVAKLKAQQGLKIVVLSNESREVNAYRVRTFRLDRSVDTFISSSFVQMRKPDVEIFRLALALAQTSPTQAVFIDNTPMFVQIADRLGMQSILQFDYESTRVKPTMLGLQTNDPV
jgi:putative hydrolase of the HAD superfamily